MNSKYQQLRNKYHTFYYNSFDILEENDQFIITFNFEIEGLTIFEPKWIFKKPKEFNFQKNKKKVETIVFNLGMVEVISYLKAVCSKRLVVKAGMLDEAQKLWWKKLYVNGLSEFFYRNNIIDEMNTNTFLEIENASPIKQGPFTISNELKGNLIPIGGGKDSLITLDILKNEKKENTCYIINSRKATNESAKTMGYEKDDVYEAKRYIDPKLIELNKQGFLNGHTPFSSIIAFSAYLVAIMLNKKHIILSNESSANESNIKDTNINHQYSKSTEFEKDFREYIATHICENGPQYFSLLRPLNEWQIVKKFAKLKHCFGVFKSCNVGSNQDIWCENCPKCIYVYIMLNAFLEEKQLKKIFKTNLLNKKEHKEIFNGLIFPHLDKPFECVGTKEEINLALNVIIKKQELANNPLPLLLQEYKKDINNLNKEIEKADNYWDYKNFLPEKFNKILKDYIN